MILDSKTATLQQLREWMGEVISKNPNSGLFWDLITALRGPDSPSETAEMSGKTFQKMYDARRKRKRRTVEVIRGYAFFGAVGGSARSRDDINYVTLPPEKEWDHFDKHVKRAADVLGLEVRYLKGKNARKKEMGEPVWEILAEGPVNKVPVKKEKDGKVNLVWSTSTIPTTSQKSWAKTHLNIEKIEKAFKQWPTLNQVDVILDGVVYTIGKQELEDAKMSHHSSMFGTITVAKSPAWQNQAMYASGAGTLTLESMQKALDKAAAKIGMSYDTETKKEEKVEPNTLDDIPF